MKSHLIASFGAALVFAGAFASPKPAAANGGMSIICRGAKRVKTMWWVNKIHMSIAFNASPKAAGPDGENLPPNSCAWPDRPLRADEVADINLGVVSDFQPATLTALIACIFDAKCVYVAKDAKMVNNCGGKNALCYIDHHSENFEFIRQ